MARGKHAKAAQHRREREASDTLDALVAALLAEDQAATAAEEAAAVTEARAMDAAELGRARDRAVAAEVERLRGVLEELAAATVREEELSEGIMRAWRRLRKTIASTFGGGIEGWEEFFTVISEGQARGLLPWGVDSRAAGGERAMHRLQRSRGLRHRAYDPKDAVRDPHGIQWLSDFERIDRYDAASPAEQTAMRTRSRQIGGSPPTVDDPDVAFAWLCMTSGVIPLALEDGVLAAFGPLLDENKERWSELTSKPDPGAMAQSKATRGNSRVLIERTRWVNPFQGPPAFARPSDATVLRWWYRQAARASATMMRAAPSLEHPDISEAWASLMDGVAGMLDEAALYWLPPGQVASYLSSNPLDERDRDELRLPYGRTLVVPADPIEVPPARFHREGPPECGDEEELKHVIAGLDNGATMAATKRVRRPCDADQDRRTVYLDDVLPLRGALIEAVLIEADRSGNRTGRVVWCAAVPSRTNAAVLTRFVVPALASECSWPEVLDQLAAVAAWGDWIEPGEGNDESGSPDHDVKGRAPLAPPAVGSLRVLDVGRTESESSSSEPTGRKLAPHTRRGHWRRQHSGPGGSIVKRVRIAPTVVNASRGLLAPRVYRLPTGPPAGPTSTP